MKTKEGLDLEALLARQRPHFTLERAFYTDEAVLDLDLERVFRRHWLFAGHACQIPKAGDYFLYQVGQDPLILIRAEDGKIHALLNVCRHRGSKICVEPQGQVKKLVCPYHQWTYNSDGGLLAARNMPEGFERGAYGLHKAQVREVEGLIFVCLAEKAPDFEPLAQGLKAHLAPYGLSQAKLCLKLRYEVKANWKLLAENFRECYHCPGGHPEYCRIVFNPDPDFYAKKFPELYAQSLARWQAQGLSTEQAAFEEGRWHHYSRLPFREGFNTESLDGKPVAPLLGSLKDPDAGVFYVVSHPNFYGLQASSSYVSSLRLTPLGPLTSEVELTWLVRGDAVEGKDYDPENVAAFWKRTAEQDFELVENNQAGVNSGFYRPGPYAQDEIETEKFVDWYLKRLAE